MDLHSKASSRVLDLEFQVATMLLPPRFACSTWQTAQLKHGPGSKDLHSKASSRASVRVLNVARTHLPVAGLHQVAALDQALQ